MFLTWLRTIEHDLQPLNIGLVSAWQRAQDREWWKRTMETATLQDGDDMFMGKLNAAIMMMRICILCKRYGVLRAGRSCLGAGQSEWIC